MSNEFLNKLNATTKGCMFNMAIDDSISELTCVLSAIEKWKDIAWAEFEEWKNDIEKRHPDGFDHECNPIADEDIMMTYTEYALYGSLAVNIAALVEKELDDLLPIAKDRSHFNDSMQKLETTCDCQREDIKHYADHLFVRELANRFKHSGGEATQAFVEKYGTLAGVNQDGKKIPYNQYCWECYIQQAKELLIDVAKRLTDNDGRKGE